VNQINRFLLKDFIELRMNWLDQRIDGFNCFAAQTECFDFSELSDFRDN
jgi:hypothetical protein